MHAPALSLKIAKRVPVLVKIYLSAVNMRSRVFHAYHLKALAVGVTMTCPHVLTKAREDVQVVILSRSYLDEPGFIFKMILVPAPSSLTHFPAGT